MHIDIQFCHLLLLIFFLTGSLSSMDTLRATSVIVHALSQGASEISPLGHGRGSFSNGESLSERVCYLGRGKE